MTELNVIIFLQDRHATGQSLPVRDDHQDWVPLYVSENATHTTFIFTRAFDTCDGQDVPLTVISFYFKEATIECKFILFLNTANIYLRRMTP